MSGLPHARTNKDGRLGLGKVEIRKLKNEEIGRIDGRAFLSRSHDFRISLFQYFIISLAPCRRLGIGSAAESGRVACPTPGSTRFVNRAVSPAVGHSSSLIRRAQSQSCGLSQRKGLPIDGRSDALVRINAGFHRGTLALASVRVTSCKNFEIARFFSTAWSHRCAFPRRIHGAHGGAEARSPTIRPRVNTPGAEGQALLPTQKGFTCPCHRCRRVGHGAKRRPTTYLRQRRR